MMTIIWNTGFLRLQVDIKGNTLVNVEVLSLLSTWGISQEHFKWFSHFEKVNKKKDLEKVKAHPFKAFFLSTLWNIPFKITWKSDYYCKVWVSAALKCLLSNYLPTYQSLSVDSVCICICTYNISKPVVQNCPFIHENV